MLLACIVHVIILSGTRAIWSIFTTRRYANAVHAVVVYLSFRLCVCVSVTLRYCVTSGSAMAEGPRDALVSRNSATTKYPYRVELFA